MTRRRVIGIAFVAGIAAMYCALCGAAKWLNVGQDPAPVDYVYILPGHSETRPFIGGFLITGGFATSALLPTVALSPEQQSGIALSHHEIARRVLRFCGVSDDQIEMLDISSTSTADESYALARFLRSRPDVRVAIVTSAYHTRRARWIFGRALGPMSKRTIILSAPNPDFREHRWWRSPAGFETVTSEYLKLLFYWIRYGWGLVFVGAATALIVLKIVFSRMRSRKKISAQRTSEVSEPGCAQFVNN